MRTAKREHSAIAGSLPATSAGQGLTTTILGTEEEAEDWETMTMNRLTTNNTKEGLAAATTTAAALPVVGEAATAAKRATIWSLTGSTHVVVVLRDAFRERGDSLERGVHRALEVNFREFRLPLVSPVDQGRKRTL